MYLSHYKDEKNTVFCKGGVLASKIYLFLGSPESEKHPFAVSKSYLKNELFIKTFKL